MDLVIFEENKPFILQSFRDGEFDYMEAASEVFEADFFRFIKARALLDELAATYPKPRKKEDVPFWFYVASNLSMRLHGVHAFDAFPMVVRSGGTLPAFGPQAGRKTVHPETGDILIPIRRNMDIYADAMALFQQSDVAWQECKPPKEAKESFHPRPQAISKREQKRQEKLRHLKQQQPSPPPEEILIKKEAAAIGEFQSWDSCTVPLTVVANREHYADDRQDIWFLIDTREAQDPCQIQQEYHLRTSIEERYRQLKCFNDLTHFTSRAFSMVVNQVVFIMLAYNLLQFYLVKQGRKELNQKTLPRIRRQLLPSDNYVIVYYQNYYGLFSPFELVGLAVTLAEEARKKIAAKCQRIGRELENVLTNPRPP
jgi:hypothetical protein